MVFVKTAPAMITEAISFSSVSPHSQLSLSFLLPTLLPLGYLLASQSELWGEEVGGVLIFLELRSGRLRAERAFYLPQAGAISKAF